MRIALLSWESLHSIVVGGVASHVSELAAALVRAGHEVHVFTRMAPGQRHHDRIDGVHYQRCPYIGHPEFVDDVNNMCRAFVERVFVVEDLVGPFDVIHAHDWLTANAMIWIKQGRGHRGVLTMHATEYARCGNVFHGGRSQRVRDQERAGTYWADRVIAVSKATLDEIKWMYELPEWKASVVYNGVSPHRFDGELDAGAVKRRYRIGPMDPLVLFCGRLEWQKGPDVLVEAIPSVLRSQPSAKFLFVGDGGMRGQLENRVRQLGVAPAVQFLGFRDGDELVRLFKACETVCVPSRNEPFGIVVLEAWSARKPVVVSQNGGPNEYVTHEMTGLKIYPHPSSVSWGLCTLFSNFERARWMGRNGRRAVEERFTWDLIAHQTVAAYGVSRPKSAAPRSRSGLETRAPAPKRSVAPELPVLVQAKLAFRGSGETGAAFVACRRILAQAGIPFQIGRRSAVLEGDWDAIAAALRRCYQVVERMADVRMTTSVNLASQAQESALAEEEDLVVKLAESRQVTALAIPDAGLVIGGARPTQSLVLDGAGR